jgi:hypothetical protein
MRTVTSGFFCIRSDLVELLAKARRDQVGLSLVVDVEP